MNQQRFETGYAAYQAGDWASAASLLGDAKAPGEVNGRIDHLRGNALMKLGRYDDAAQAYAEALPARHKYCRLCLYRKAFSTGHRLYR